MHGQQQQQQQQQRQQQQQQQQDDDDEQYDNTTDFSTPSTADSIAAADTWTRPQGFGTQLSPPGSVARRLMEQFRRITPPQRTQSLADEIFAATGTIPKRKLDLNQFSSLSSPNLRERKPIKKEEYINDKDLDQLLNEASARAFPSPPKRELNEIENADEIVPEPIEGARAFPSPQKREPMEIDEDEADVFSPERNNEEERRRPPLPVINAYPPPASVSDQDLLDQHIPARHQMPQVKVARVAADIPPPPPTETTPKEASPKKSPAQNKPGVGGRTRSARTLNEELGPPDDEIQDIAALERQIKRNKKKTKQKK